MRTTVDIDTPLLNDLRKLQKREGKSLGLLISELLAEALGRRKAGLRKVPPPFTWNTTRGRLLVELTDADAVYAVLDADVVERQKR